MKNKISAIMLGLCALAIMSACNKIGADNILQDANLKIRLHVDSPATTKTTGSATVADGESEYAISSLDICLVSTTSLSPTSTVTIINNPRKLAWKELSGSVHDYEVNVIVPDTMTGDYLLYVIANRPSWMTIETYGDICGTFTETAVNLADCWADNNFLMINAQDAITDPSADQAGVPITMAPNSDDAVVSATVTIERLAAKILVRENPYMEVAPLLTQVLCTGDPEDPTVPDIKGAIAAMSLDEYSLFNCVKSFNLIQRWSAASSTGDTEKLLVSPSSDATTPYDMSAGYYDNDPASLTFGDLGTVFYCMENNSPYYTSLVTGPSDATAGTKMKGRVTGLVFKARAGFAKSFSGDAVIKDSLYVDDNEIPWTTKGGDPDTNDDISWTTLYQYKGDYYGDISCLLKHNSALATALGTPSPTVEQLRAKGVKVYVDGYMYYNYWITDPNYTDNGKHYLSVMRNTSYDIKITAINSLGDEFPCGGSSFNSSDPISVDVPKLSISMDIPDWAEKTGNYTIL